MLALEDITVNPFLRDEETGTEAGVGLVQSRVRWFWVD